MFRNEDVCNSQESRSIGMRAGAVEDSLAVQLIQRTGADVIVSIS